MRIGLISDTHIPEAGQTVPHQVFTAFRGVDLILHAGDMHVVQVLDWLENIAPVLGARGNGDVYSSEWRPGVPEDPRVKNAHVVEVDGWVIGLTHGFPTPDIAPWLPLEDAMNRFFTKRVDILICGDTHVARIKRYNGIMEVNPGSPTLPGNLHSLGTLGILEIAPGYARSEIIHLK